MLEMGPVPMRLRPRRVAARAPDHQRWHLRERTPRVLQEQVLARVRWPRRRSPTLLLTWVRMWRVARVRVRRVSVLVLERTPADPVLTPPNRVGQVGSFRIRLVKLRSKPALVLRPVAPVELLLVPNLDGSRPVRLIHSSHFRRSMPARVVR